MTKAELEADIATVKKMAERVWPLDFKEGEPPALVRALYAAAEHAKTLPTSDFEANLREIGVTSHEITDADCLITQGTLF